MALASSDKTINWLLRAIAAFLCLGLIYLAVKTIIAFTNPESVWKQPAIVPVTLQGQNIRVGQNFTFTTDPFNRAAETGPEMIAEAGEDAPETTLNLTLTGRTAGTNGTAILRTPDNKEGNYRIGDEIISGVTLEAVNKGFIVLDVDGEIQRLTFERGDETGLLASAETMEKIDSKVTVTRFGNSNTGGKASANATQSATISGDVSSLFQNLSLRRIMKNGQLLGYSVKPNRPGVDLTPYGFTKGDVVTAIGGTDITRGRPDFLALFEQAAQSGGTEVTVLRNGQVKTIKLGTP
ncbi:type II secretion system protein N [Hellea balneolensis]|uniref:type II secretion system protein N n=1 Tax=Hellea balneolensis TaxID=287478 RepID=UPI0004280DC2|nr:type II secretion system protein N [Hellea balneolensis]